MSDSGHGEFAERRAKRQALRLKAAAREVESLREAGMGPHEIVAAFRARRRLMADPDDHRPMIGLVPVLPLPRLILPIEDGDPIEPPECIMLEIYDDIDDD